MNRILPFVAMLAVSPLASAQDMGAYLGFALGSLDYEEESEELGIEFSDSATAYRLFGGYRFNENLALEGGWGATGDLEESYSDGFDTVTITADYEILTLRALGIVPLDGVSLYGGVGYFDATVDAAIAVNSAGVIARIEDDDTGATLVGGLQFELENVAIRAEFEWFDTDSNVEAWDVSIGVLIRL